MDLVCPNCHARYRVASDAVPPEGREIACAKCGERWHQPQVEREPEPEPLSDPAPLGVGIADVGAVDMNAGMAALGPAADATPVFDETPERARGGIGAIGWLLILVLLGIAAAVGYGVYSGQLTLPF